MTWTRNLHRRPLTNIFHFFALATLIIIGGGSIFISFQYLYSDSLIDKPPNVSAAIAILALYHNQVSNLPTLLHAALGTDSALALFMWIAAMLYVHKSMSEYALGHK
jgi:hypothetical protein